MISLIIDFITMQSLLKKTQQKITSQRETLQSAILLPAATIMHAKCYDLFLHYVDTLNHLRAGDTVLVTVMAVGLRCSNMRGCIFDKWCWRTDTAKLITHILFNL